ncbi:MAG TPA: DUF6055 domain-containing protein [Phycisphaerae bacterium]|nr:DUF6055 domain-containing protein [Phycisphaerae bacterium]
MKRFALSCLWLALLAAVCHAQPTPPARPRNVTFLSTSDPHYKAFEARDWNQADRQTIEEMNRVASLRWPEQLGGEAVEQPRGVVVLGDCIDDGDRVRDGKDYTAEQYKLFLADFGLDGTDGLLKFRVYETWGNHDGPPIGQSKASRFSFQAELKKRNARRKAKGWLANVSDNGLHYSWDWDDVHLVSLGFYPADRQHPKVRYNPNWHDPQGALTFLKQDLAKCVGGSGRPVVLMSHAGFDSDWWHAEDYKAVYDAAKEYNVVLYLYGHTGTGLRDWAPEGETNKWTCINDGHTTSGFFIIQIAGDRIRAAYRCKEAQEITKGPDGSFTPQWGGQWSWRFRLDRKIAGRPAEPSAAVQPTEEPKAWLDNERKFRSDDPNYNVRRSEHFRIVWGNGAGKQERENADFARASEELAQGNLQMLEQLWHRLHDPAPRGMGFHIPRNSNKPEHADANSYRANLLMNNTGIWAGGAWGACDEWGFPLYALPPSYLRFDPPSGATPHEYGHTVLINAAGFNDTPYDGMWHEATANWLQLQFNNSYPGPGGVGTQPFLSVPHGRNYYDCWQIWEHFREDPRYGCAFVNKVWTQARGTRSKGAEYMFDAMVRLDTSGSPDSHNAIKDAVGRMAARNVMWDYQRQPYFQKHSPRTMDPLSEMYRRAYTELVRRGGDRTSFRVPFAHAPMQCGYNVVPIALTGKTGGGYTVSLDFKPLWDATRRSDWRATLVAVNDNGESRYGALWNGGVNSITLSADENQLFLVVAATPDFMPFNGFERPRISDLPLQPQAYEVTLVNTQATAYESRPVRPEGVKGKPHVNGGGFVAETATVDPGAYVGPDAMVLGRAKVLDTARVEDFAVVMDSAVVKDRACLSGHALVRDSAEVSGRAKVRDWATVGGKWKVYENGRALERAYLRDRGELHGHATIKGNTHDFGGAKVSGHAIKDGDCCNGADVDHQVLTCWVWGTDQKYADKQPDTGGLYCNFAFRRTSPIYALDTFGVMHGYLMGSPRTHAMDDKACPGALELNGKDQYVELRRDVADFGDTTIAVWVNWAGGAAGQRIVHFGDGKDKYAYLTPKDTATGKARFVISIKGKAGEQAIGAPAALPVGTWTHLAVTLTGETAALYVDGKPVATNQALTLDTDMVLAANTLAGNGCTFLGRGDKDGYFKGLLTDFRVYVRPQDAGAIASLAGRMPNRGAAVVAGPEDTAPPKPAKGGFLLKPTLVGDSAVVMSAPKGSDDSNQLECFFACTRGNGHDSGWITSNRWTDCGLAQGKTYAYTYKMRDASGNQTAASAAESVTVPADVAPPAPAAFEKPPVGISPTAIRMTARKAPDACGLVEYRFTRDDGHASGWQSSRTWTDSPLPEGAKHSYTVQARDGRGNATKASAPGAAVARDDTPPARYAVGEWQSLPYATLDNCVAMRAMSVTGAGGCPKIEPDPVEYYFQCVSGNGPDSGWIDSPFWKTMPLPDGKYTYQFRIRDTSPQHNETPYSTVEAAVVSPTTGYHDCPLAEFARKPDGALVVFKGKVAAVEPKAYVVAGGAARIRVVPKTVANATDPQWKGRDVSIKGCVWTCNGHKQVMWAELK